MKKSLLLIIPLLIFCATLAAQTFVTGVIKDREALPIPGAIVKIIDDKTVVVADANGNFKIAAPKELPFTLNFSFIGFKSQEVDIYEMTNVPLEIVLVVDNFLDEVVVTSRRRKEVLQDVPIPITVITGALVADANAFNVNRLKEIVPSVQLYSSNPRNTGLSIRGLGTTFGLTNDGIDPGVGFYVDGVYYARTAATTFDFIDVEQIEVLRGPQGTLFGKNTTAGAFNITTRKPSFTSGAKFELSYGNYGFIQAKSSITGTLTKKIAGRLSFTGTQRDGLLYNVATQKHVNDLNNLGARGQLLFTPTKKIEILLAGDVTRQRPDGYAQVVAGVAPTKRAAYRQFDQIIADLGYQLPALNAFDRIIDHDTPWRSGQDLGGVTLNADIEVGTGTITSTSAWRYWNWDPSNDRDFTGKQALKLSQAPSRHQQWSQEVRWAGRITSRVTGVFGIFAFKQNLKTNPYHSEESGSDQWRFAQSTTSELWKTPGLLDGYGIRTTSELNTFSGALFGQVDWTITKKLHLLPGLRYNYDEKKIDFSRKTYGGLQTTDPALIAIKNLVYTDQAFNASIDKANLSGQITLSYQPTKKINAFATFSTGFKPVGLNLGGLPNKDGQPWLELAVIKPEEVRHYEFGLKTSPTKNSILNFTVYNTDIKDYQTQVQAAELGVNRGYLANAEKVRVRGAEIDVNIKFLKYFSLYGALAYTDGIYVSFTNAPLPLEETGQTVDGKQVAFKDISGGDLPGISKWAGSWGGDFSLPGRLLSQSGDFFIAFDAYYRSKFSSNPSPSSYLVVDSYALLNGRFGFRATKGVSVFIWGRNLTNTDYFEQLLPGAGNAGHYAGVLGDPRTFGITLRHSF